MAEHGCLLGLHDGSTRVTTTASDRALLADHPRLRALKVKIFADGASLEEIRRLADAPLIAGVTTNPTLMRKAGVADYRSFATELLAAVTGVPVSLEVVADDLAEIERQAREIASWGANVYVKVPVTNSLGELSTAVLRRLAADGVQVNVTAVTTIEQARTAVDAVAGGAPAIISIFAGRIADTGIDPVPTVREAKRLATEAGNVEILWASPREVLNIFQADEAGCDIITVTNDLLEKLASVGKDLDTFSLETVRMFLGDALASGYQI